MSDNVSMLKRISHNLMSDIFTKSQFQLLLGHNYCTLRLMFFISLFLAILRAIPWTLALTPFTLYQTETIAAKSIWHQNCNTQRKTALSNLAMCNKSL